MPEQKKLTFQQTFSRCSFPPEVIGELGRCPVEVRVNRAERSMKVEIYGIPSCSREILTRAEEKLVQYFRLRSARMFLMNPQLPERTENPGSAGKKPEDPEPGEQNRMPDLFLQMEQMRKTVEQRTPAGSGGREEKHHPVRQIFGKISTKKKPVPMSDLTLDMGTVLVEGDVFNVEHRELPKRKAWVVCFDVTDYTGSIRVNQFMDGDVAKPIIREIRAGQHVQVQGRLSLSRFDTDLVLEPYGINELPKPEERKDTAAEKRIELHLHTKMSMMDALCDTKEVVKRAIRWGHPAIAITDHGVVHSFPDAYNASGKGEKIKILYGVEAYYQNDRDERIAVHGPRDQDLGEEYIAFDLETTGLDSRTDQIIEIGAVLFRNGLPADRFSSFAQPGEPLSANIVALTHITDEMLAGAPTPQEAVGAFLDWAGSRTLVGHNAEFDVGFLRTCCGTFGREFDPAWVDTLVLSQFLCPKLSSYKLTSVASALDLPPFQAHRAYEDAQVCGQIYAILISRLQEMGVSRQSGINKVLGSRKQELRARRQNYHLILLAKNQTGLRNLYRLVSQSHLEHFNRVPVMTKTMVEENREGLIIGSACEAGELFRAIVENRDQEDLERLASWYDFLEIQPLSNNAFMLRPDKNGRRMARDEEDLRNFNRKVVELGNRLGKPVCATGDVHFIDPEQEIYRHILLAAKEFDGADEPNPLYFRTTEEMLEEFSYLGRETAHQVVIENPSRIASWVDQIHPLPQGLFTPKIEHSEEQLTSLVWSRAHELYGDQLPEIVTDRINAELKDIIRCHYDVIYMSAQKLVQNSLEHGYLVGSRGSVGSSLVAFLSGITEVNSLPAHYRCPHCRHSDFSYAAEHGYGCGADMPDQICPVCGTPYEKDGFQIPFETFLGFGGDKVPDIDLNFSGEFQASAHRYTFELFGDSHVFRAGTIGTVAEKTAIGYVKKYMELTGRENLPFAEVLRLARGCIGVKRTTGQHPGGMVVIPQDKEIYDFCPVQHPADDKNSEIVTTHFEYHSMESNLLKLDLLGHDDPSMIRMLQDLTGVDPRKIHLDDPDTMSLFSTSEKLGYRDDPILGPTGAVAVPEFNTKFTRQMLEDTHPTDFNTLLRISGFSHGTDVWLGNARDLILSGTAGVLECVGCRDDIMLYLISMGIKDKRAFKIMESVRKGRGLPEGAEEEMREHGVPQWYIDSCRKIAYLFPKAHAVAYVMMAFRIAWFKVHCPLEFYAAYFSIRAKAFDEKVMCRGMETVKQKIRELTARKNARDRAERLTAAEEDMLVTLEVCYEFYLRGFHFTRMDLYRSHSVNFLINEEKNALIPPFTSIAGLGETVGDDIVKKRRGKTFISIEDFSLTCTKASSTHIAQMKEAGAFGSMPDSSQISLF